MQVLTLLLAATALPASVAGLYQSQTMEVGAALELRKGGHFRYQLDYGAISEHAEGEWTFDGKAVRLTTKPAPRKPSFELVHDDPAPIGQLNMTIEPPGFGHAYRLDAIATDVSGAKGRVTTDEKGRAESGNHKLAAVDPLIPVYDTVAGHFPLSPDRGHRLTFRFHANDLETAAFDREALAFTGHGLVLNRYESEIRFIRVRP